MPKYADCIWHRLAPEAPFHWRRPRRILVAWDPFLPGHDPDDVAATWGLMAASPQHTFLVLTAYPDAAVAWCKWVLDREEAGRSMFPHDDAGWRIRQLFQARAGRTACMSGHQHHGGPWPVPNIWLGTRASTQWDLDLRGKALLRCPAALRWLLAEPAQPLEVRNGEANRWSMPTATDPATGTGIEWTDPGERYVPFDWIVVAKEIGRRLDPAHAGRVVSECRASTVSSVPSVSSALAVPAVPTTPVPAVWIEVPARSEAAWPAWLLGIHEVPEIVTV
jgi:hypothetical protein